jgi:hypothetical protein
MLYQFQLQLQEQSRLIGSSARSSCLGFWLGALRPERPLAYQLLTRAMMRTTLAMAGTLAALAISACGTVQRADGDEGGMADGSPDADGSRGQPGGIDSGSGPSDGGPDASIQPTFFVDAVDGDDASDGTTPESAFRTITHALGQTAPGDVVQVGPGTYDAALGEAFPLAVPAGVTLVGDVANKGAGIAIVGTGGFPTTMTPGFASVLAGLTIRSADPEVSTTVLDIVGSNVAVESCSFTDESDIAINLRGGSGHIVRGNLLLRNGVAIAILDSVGARIEGNVIRENSIGVRHGSLAGDLGGGETGSTGGNVIACNVFGDLETNLGGSATIPAADNAWDHVPPSESDIENPNGASVVATGATVAADPCR